MPRRVQTGGSVLMPQVTAAHVESGIFELSVDRVGERYRVHVVSPEGRAAREFSLPPELAASSCLASFAGRLRDVASPGAASPALMPKDIGTLLFDALFTDEILACFKASQVASRREGTALRLCVRLSIDAPEIAGWPWECLFYRGLNRFLSLSSDSPVSRFFELPEKTPPLAVEPPLRMLIVISAPGDYPKLEAEKEWANLASAVEPLSASGLLSFSRIDRATLPAILDRLKTDSIHVLHFVGHGGFSADMSHGEIILEDDVKGSRRVTGLELAPLLHDVKSLRLVVLNSCEGARSSPFDAFSGIAQTLLPAGVPAVIAMQAPISDDVAITFAANFYKGVASGQTLDVSVTQARQAIVAAHDDSSEWAIPVLYLAPGDGHIFEFARPTHGDASRSSEEYRVEPPYGAIGALLTSGQVVPFLGPGASLMEEEPSQPRSVVGALSAPSVHDLARRLAESSSFPAEDRHLRENLTQVASYFADSSSRRALRATLHQIYDQSFAYCPIHRLLAENTEPLLIVTTNYDTLLEQAFAEAGRSYDLIVYPTDRSEFANAVMWWPPGSAEPTIMAPNELLVPLHERCAIFKMSGSVVRTSSGRDSFVITEEDHVDFLARMNGYTAFPAQFLDHCRDRSLLFLGCRLDDWPLRVMMKVLRRHIDQKRAASAEEITSWAVQPEVSEFERLMWQRCDVHPFTLSLDAFAAAVALWSRQPKA